MYRRLIALAVAGLSLGWLGGCSTEDNVCTPGETQRCTCPGGGISSQRCDEDGSQYGQCRCGIGTASDTAPDTDDGMSPGEPEDTNMTRDDTGTTEGDAEGSLDGGASDVADATIESAGPSIEVQSRVTFSGVAPGTRASARVPVGNSGTDPLTVDKVEVVGNSQFVVTKALDQTGGVGSGDGGTDGPPAPTDDEPISVVEGETLAPGESVDVRVYFMPGGTSSEGGELVISSDAPASSEETIELSGNSEMPCLGLSHGQTVDFGAASAGRTATQTVTVQNCRSQAEDLSLHDIEVVSDTEAFEVTNLPGELSQGNSFKLEENEKKSFAVEFTPSETETYNGQIRIESNDPAYGDARRIDLVGTGDNTPCPTAVASAGIARGGQLREPGDDGTVDIDTLPGETIRLDGTRSSDQGIGSVERYEWSIIDRPADSMARLMPTADVADPELFVDLAGEYTVELVVYDDEDVRSCGQRALVNVRAVPDDDIHVQLVWDTPTDPDETDTNGTDLNLHYLNSGEATSWNEAPWDIFWYNKTADWGVQNDPSDDPALDIDDTDGAGPEVVEHNNPNPDGGPYKVGVHYYDDNGFGPSYATVRIFVRGELAKEYKNEFMKETFDFWTVGIIEWPGGKIFKRDEMSDGFPTP